MRNETFALLRKNELSVKIARDIIQDARTHLLPRVAILHAVALSKSSRETNTPISHLSRKEEEEESDLDTFGTCDL